MIYEKSHHEYLLSDDKTRLDSNSIHRFLSQESYWAANIPLELLQKAIAHSHCYGIYTQHAEQVGFARVITDFATFGYLEDVYILEGHRGKGLGKAFMQYILEDEQLQSLRQILLATRDAKEFYRGFGFNEIERPERFMQKRGVLNYL